MRILGIDPGSRRTGFGVIDEDGSRLVYVTCGIIAATEGTMPRRLQAIFSGLNEVIGRYGPSAVAIERVFFAHNADSALKLGQARGVALLSVAQANLAVDEYSALQIKKACVGVGHAGKGQVQHMIRALLGLSAAPSADAADALAAAICHAHHRSLRPAAGDL